MNAINCETHLWRLFSIEERFREEKHGKMTEDIVEDAPAREVSCEGHQET